jgi:small subunit ribosomal protein S18
MMCTVLAIPPPQVRPSVLQDNNQRSEDDLTQKLIDIIKANTTLAEKIAKKSTTDVVYVDYKNAEDLRRLLTPNGKILSRKRTGIGAAEQRLVSTAIKRARFMALLPYTSATV